MIQQTPGKIFLSDDRGCLETSVMRTRNTFNFGSYYHEHKNPFGNLYALNEDTLAPGCKMHVDTDRRTYLLILPVVGLVAYSDSRGNITAVEAGQLYIILLEKGTHGYIKNPADENLVNFLQWRISADGQSPAGEVLAGFDINADRNNLAGFDAKYNYRFFNSLPFYPSIAKMDGRTEIEYSLKQKTNKLFVFVIQGAFEVQNRLLHQGDGLALWNLDNLEAEALSNDAIIMILEMDQERKS
ncbi:MAG: hypothetical protein KIT80_04695 [Chitinophagaceae bacterium]|nr:hypothetical protein [Chitinophagaceae bacterium]MCW5926190.1 hypothetical protein [Chitinophagaceae bacterium]